MINDTIKKNDINGDDLNKNQYKLIILVRGKKQGRNYPLTRGQRPPPKFFKYIYYYIYMCINFSNFIPL